MSQTKPRRKKGRVIRIALLLAVLLAVFSIAGVVIAGEMMIDETKLTQMSQTSTVYDADGQEIASLYVENRKLIEDFDKVPDYVRDAFIATEDRRFYKHFGVDPIGILRALVVNLQAGRTVEGGSTITQQLAKLTYLTHDRTLSRKIKEAIIAVNLERKFSKDEILEMYLNQVYFGHGAYGIETASQLYFGKSVTELTLGEAALLAGLPKAPNDYSPFNDLQKAMERRKVILKLMEEQQYITAEERQMAEREEIRLAERPKRKTFAQAYLDYLVKEAEKKYGFTEAELYRGGYKIYTNLNRQAQEAIEAVFADDQYFPKSADDQKIESGMVILDHQTGGILAMAGGRDYVPKGLNWATQRDRQPGSSFKPIAVYGPALEEGWSPYDLLVDKKITYKEYGNWTPTNPGGRYRGQVTMMTAVTDSINASAAWLLNEIGVEKGYEFATRLGVPMAEQDRHNLAISLGGLTHGVSPLDMAQAYTAFGNNGKMMRAYAIQKITTQDDRLIVQAEPNGETVMSPQSAYYMTRMLENVVKEGTGKNARMDRAVAGKTGTVALDPKVFKVNGNKDAWFVGYTPEWTAAVWMGYPKTDEKHYLKFSGGSYPAKLFKEVMRRALKGHPVTQFERPEGVAELIPPVQLTQITDLKGQYNPAQQAIELSWTPLEPEGAVGYRVYRRAEPANWLGQWLNGRKGEQKNEENPQEQGPAEGQPSEAPPELGVAPQGDTLIGESREGYFRDEGVDSRYTYTYYVIPYNLKTGEEGPKSNEAVVEVTGSGNLKDYLKEWEKRWKNERPEEENPQEEQPDPTQPPDGNNPQQPPSEGDDSEGNDSGEGIWPPVNGLLPKPPQEEKGKGKPEQPANRQSTHPDALPSEPPDGWPPEQSQVPTPVQRGTY
ncbi:MAG: hypothetical protein BAA01_15850 [Bacillus thermozeamaize]|uniref:Uncharacterized protein n=1 Tax=Bacillus thermozeamaize TaxID=230954 RepID=A0A1Y3PSJ2_9BACI|nr:MAG: hypothetical protein BAA01_15850 [Bacillus thermozeamaize]